MRVSELYPDNPLRGQDVYIVGSGPSLDVLPPDYLCGRVCLCLNDTWRFMSDCSPAVIANNRKFVKGCELPIQIVKGRLRFESNVERTDNHTPWGHDRYYVFSYREPVIKTPSGPVATGDQWSHFDERALWAEPDFFWNVKDGSIAVFACQVAILCGARSIHLVGCDCCEFPDGAEYVGTKHRVAKVEHNYDQYAGGLMRMVQEGRRLGVPIVAVQPFPGLGRHIQQWERMRKWT